MRGELPDHDHCRRRDDRAQEELTAPDVETSDARRRGQHSEHGEQRSRRNRERQIRGDEEQEEVSDETHECAAAEDVSRLPGVSCLPTRRPHAAGDRQQRVAADDRKRGNERDRNARRHPPHGQHCPSENGSHDGHNRIARRARLGEQTNGEDREKERDSPQRRLSNGAAGEEEKERNTGERERRSGPLRREWRTTSARDDRYADEEQPEHAIDRQCGEQAFRRQILGRPHRLRHDGEERGDEMHRAIATHDGVRRTGSEQREQNTEWQ